MKFVQTGTFKEDTLDNRVNIHPMESIGQMFFDKLDYLLGYIANDRKEIIGEYVNTLSLKLLGLVHEDYATKFPVDVELVCSDYQNLYQYLDLSKIALNYFIELLQIKEYADWEKSNLEISQKALIQAWTYPSYYLLQALEELIGRDEAFTLYKRYITQYHVDHPSPDREENFNLEDFLKKRLSGDRNASDWVIVHTMLENGKYAFKNKNCPTCVDAMTELSDVEIKYLVCCYGDFAKFRASYSDHLILTMEHTLMEGAQYCSRVLHDTRVDYDLRHPPKEFWDNFEPGKEEIAEEYYTKSKADR